MNGGKNQVKNNLGDEKQPHVDWIVEKNGIFGVKKETNLKLFQNNNGMKWTGSF